MRHGDPRFREGEAVEFAENFTGWLISQSWGRGPDAYDYVLNGETLTDPLARKVAEEMTPEERAQSGIYTIRKWSLGSTEKVHPGSGALFVSVIPADNHDAEVVAYEFWQVEPYGAPIHLPIKEDYPATHMHKIATFIPQTPHEHGLMWTWAERMLLSITHEIDIISLN